MIRFDDFLLPKARIATRPKEPREQANLLACVEGEPQNTRIQNPRVQNPCIQNPRIQDLRVQDLPSLLKQGDVLVANDTKVLPARLSAKLVAEQKNSNSEAALDSTPLEATPLEVTPLEVTLAEKVAPNVFRAFVKGKLRDHRDHSRLQFGSDAHPFFARMEARDSDGLLRLKFENLSEEELYDRLESAGAMPLPPYLKRRSDAQDKHDYQTLFARHRGAFAAPTAGRHLTPSLIATLKRKGIETLFVTLHVSFGSFRPVRDDARTPPRMAREAFAVSKEVAARIQTCRQGGGRVLAVGTTVVRALETAALYGDDAGGAFCGETSLFIGEGFRFQSCDLLLTNFHQARATPLLLTCAFASEETVRRAYAHARACERYRFFSYGDVCLFARRK